MCGIIFVDGSSIKSARLQRGYSTLIARGPDCGTIITERKRFYGFRRLKIVDMSEKGNQPFMLGSIKMMCNGEIYNHLDLEREYGLECKSKSDCECIIHLYKKIGFEQTVRKLDGVFAIILVDGEDIYFARDRIGVRPLFISTTVEGGGIALASIADALSGFCKNIEQVRPSIVKYSKRFNTFYTEHYSYPSYVSQYKNSSEHIRNTLESAVRKRLMMDRPMGCLLSGGLDSSIITSILCKQIGAENVRTYSIGMENGVDLKYAKKVADYLGTNHTSVIFTAEQACAIIPEVINILESYDITTIRASIGMYLLCKYISKSTKDIVIFSGEGSDELLMGYLYFYHAPCGKTAETESARLVTELYLYDVLRADRCISSNGLEPRVPFLDKDFVNLCSTLSGETRRPLVDRMEKWILREAFKDGYLPEEVLWRVKSAFSDAVTSVEKSLFEYIQEFVETKVSDAEFEPFQPQFPSKEAYYYRKVFNQIFPNYQPRLNYWLPRWVDCGGNPSARILNVFKELNADKV